MSLVRNNNLRSSTSYVYPSFETSGVDMDTLIATKRNYTNMKNSLLDIIVYLNNAIASLETPGKRIGELYTIDSVSIDKGRITTIRNDILARRNYINNVLLPEIDKKIRKINESIG